MLHVARSWDHGLLELCAGLPPHPPPHIKSEGRAPGEAFVVSAKAPSSKRKSGDLGEILIGMRQMWVLKKGEGRLSKGALSVRSGAWGTQ